MKHFEKYWYRYVLVILFCILSICIVSLIFQPLASLFSGNIVWFEKIWVPILVSIIALVGISYQLSESRNQKARDYYSKARLEWIEELRKLYSVFIGKMHRESTNFGKTDDIVLESLAVDKTAIKLMLNPIDDFDQDILLLLDFLLLQISKRGVANATKKFDNTRIILDIMVNHYFKYEWEKAKAEIKSKDFDKANEILAHRDEKVNDFVEKNIDVGKDTSEYSDFLILLLSLKSVKLTDDFKKNIIR